MMHVSSRFFLCALVGASLSACQSDSPPALSLYDLPAPAFSADEGPRHGQDIAALKTTNNEMEKRRREVLEAQRREKMGRN